jgi:shikimate kinase
VAELPALVLIGAPGAGKTRIGKRVARLLDLPFVDTDKRVVALHGGIPEIFATQGEPRFRELEREQVALALAEHAVVSLGGGAVLDPATQAELEPLRVVQLTVSAEAIAKRNIGSGRPLLANGVEAWTALVAARAPIYDRLADATFDTSQLPAERIADDIVRWLEENA